MVGGFQDFKVCGTAVHHGRVATMKQNCSLLCQSKRERRKGGAGVLDPLKGTPNITGSPSTELHLLKSVRHLWKHVRTKR